MIESLTFNELMPISNSRKRSWKRKFTDSVLRVNLKGTTSQSINRGFKIFLFSMKYKVYNPVDHHMPKVPSTCFWPMIPFYTPWIKLTHWTDLTHCSDVSNASIYNFEYAFISQFLQYWRFSEMRLTFNSQPAITCSKLTLETLEQDVKYVQSQQ